MILVDTNVWIDFFKGKSNAHRLTNLLQNHQVVVHELIYGELLVGNLGSQHKQILAHLAAKGLIQSDALPEIENFVYQQKLLGLGLSYIDVQLLYCALTSDHILWTHDKILKKMSLCLNVGYE